jgi:3-isopropylmalate/(R)-2-methylmalate dehydratase small subunit
MKVDIETRTFSVPALEIEVGFELDDSTRERFLKGLDDIGITLANEAQITEFETTRPAYKVAVPGT